MPKKEIKNNKKENSKNKKSFFKDFKAELKKVVWPTPKQLVNNTVAVITIVLITAAIVFVLDLTFETLNKHGVDKVKEAITQIDEETNNDENTNTNSDSSSESESTEQNTSTENVTNETNTENTDNVTENTAQ